MQWKIRRNTTPVCSRTIYASRRVRPVPASSASDSDLQIGRTRTEDVEIAWNPSRHTVVK